MKYLHWISPPAVVALALACACPLLHAAPATQESVTPLEALRRVATDAVQAHASDAGGPVTVVLNDLDPRLRLAACTQPLDGSIVGDGQLHEYTTIAVHCAGSVRWTIYTRATVSTDLHVLVARSALTRNAEPSITDFETSRRTVPGTGADYITSAEALHGLRLRQALAAGEVLTRGRLEAAVVVHRGQKVTLLARNAGLEIRVSAVALTDGRAAERIQVQNESSRQIVDAVVRDASIVEVPL